MPISFHCETCRRSICVPDGSEGKKTRCPQCYSIVKIPFSGNVTLLKVPETPEFAQPETDDPLGISGKNESRWDQPGPQYADLQQPAEQPSAQDLPTGNQPSVNPFSDHPESSADGEVASRLADNQQQLKWQLRMLTTLATILMIFAVVMLFPTLLWVSGRVIVMLDQPHPDSQTLGRVGGLMVIFVIQLVTIAALNEARRLRNYTTARTGFILAILPFSNPAACLLAPLGLAIWGLTIIQKQEIRAAFKSEQGHTPD